MAKALVAHAPHIAFVAVGVIAYLWAGLRHRRSAPAKAITQRAPERRRASRPFNVRRSVARRGLLMLGPLSAVVITGAVLLGFNAGGISPPAGVVWTHVGVCILVLLLVVYKLAGVGAAAVRRAFALQKASQLLSLALTVLIFPLLITGVVLIFAPSTASFAAYLHLIVSAWWTGLLAAHVWRYLTAARRAVSRTRAAVAETAEA